MISPEQRYRNAIRKARIRSDRDLRRFLAGEIEILATSDFERRELIGAIGQDYEAGLAAARQEATP